MTYAIEVSGGDAEENFAVEAIMKLRLNTPNTTIDGSDFFVKA